MSIMSNNVIDGVQLLLLG